MDIEGHEFNWLNSLSKDQMKKIKQLVIEFHYPLAHQQKWDMLKKLTDTHYLIHLHPNSGCGFTKGRLSGQERDIIIPHVFECTYILKEIPQLSDEEIPGILDRKNSECENIVLRGYPYNTY